MAFAALPASLLNSGTSLSILTPSGIGFSISPNSLIRSVTSGLAQTEKISSSSLSFISVRKASLKALSSKLKQMKRDQRKKRALRDAFLTEMNDSELEEVFSVWARPEVTDIINEFGDIENPIPLGVKMLREVPEFRRLAGRAAKAILWS